MKKLIITILLILLPACVLGFDTGNKWALGFYDTGLGIKHFSEGNTSWELRGIYKDDAYQAGGRYYWLFRTDGKINLYAGFSLDGLYYDIQASPDEGMGAAGSAYIGIEFSFLKVICVGIDYGPKLTCLWDFSGTSSNKTENWYNISVFFLF